MGIASLSVISLIALVSYALYQRLYLKNRKPLPPGPKPIPLLGNILDFPRPNVPPYQHWLAHKDLYGGISSVTTLGETLVLVHDKSAARILLEKLASKTSGRPPMTMANKLCGYGRIILCEDYSPSFVRHRAYLHRELGTKVSAATFRGSQENAIQRQLVQGLNEPEKWLQHCRTAINSTVLKMTYGYNVETDGSDELVSLIEKTLSNFSLASLPLAWMVDIVPALQHLPDWLPGTHFKKAAREWRSTLEATAYIPYEFVQRQVDGFINTPSYVSRLMQHLRDPDTGTLKQEDEDAIVWSATSLFGAGSDTSITVLTLFTAAMCKFPHVQRRAQEEIDRVVGTDRLPTFDDREMLPYVDAIFKEVVRWWPVTAMGFPHTATEDIEFNDYCIPKGAHIVPAVWWFLHDPEVYANPESFEPARFLSPRNEPDPSTETFGYGRRVCPGRFFADAGVYLNIAQSLAAFSFSKALGEDGKEIEIDLKPNPGILNYPTDFDFKVQPRSDKHVALIRQIESQLPEVTGDAHLLENMEQYKARHS